MSIVIQNAGPAVARWCDEEPLIWTMSETIGQGSRSEAKEYPFDLTTLVPGFARGFLLELKEVWIERRLKVKLRTIAADEMQVRRALLLCQAAILEGAKERGLSPSVFDRIDSDLITTLWAIKSKVPRSYLEGLRRLYRNHRSNSTLFEPSIHLGDLPSLNTSSIDSVELKEVGKLRKNVLASALSRATLVQILNITESAFEDGALTLDLYAFSRLLLSRVARPESFRLLRLKDLLVDTSEGTNKYFLAITIPKARTAAAPRVTVPLHLEVGRILVQQQMAVAQRLGNLVKERNAQTAEANSTTGLFTLGDLPLFPSGGASHRRPMFNRAKQRLGIHATASNFTERYVDPLKELTGAKITHTAMRHTMGTQLAIAGCSARTIAAVLLHASERSAAVYVDLTFSGAIDELSDSLEPAFLAHFPVIKEFISRNDAVDPARRIVSTSVDANRHETTGECGRSSACQFAPIVCYGCHRFKPCYDVDHSINLEVVNEEIESAQRGGLARQADVKSFTHIATRLRVVISICELKRAGADHQPNDGRGTA